MCYAEVVSFGNLCYFRKLKLYQIMDELEFDDTDETLDELELGQLSYSTTFLKVLCVLTFIGSGFWLAFLLIFYFNPNNLVALGLNMKNQVGLTLFFTEILPPFICITGAILMIRLNRFGYIFYVVGAGLPVIYTLSLALYHGLDPLTSVTAIILRYTVNIGFIIMYGTQLYVMKPWSSKPKSDTI